MHDVERALAEIGDIRSRLAAGAMFRGFGPLVIAITGGLAFATAAAQVVRPAVFAASAEIYLVYWIGTASICLGLVGTEMFARTRRLHGGLGDAMLVNAFENFLPAGVAGVAVWAVMVKFAPQELWLLPGLWQLLVALGVFAAARSLPRAVNLVAAWYFMAGVGVLVISARSQQLDPWAMGLPFGIGQLLMAGVLKLAGDGDHDEA